MPNLVPKNAGNHPSWELKFQTFPVEHLLGPQWQIQGSWGTCVPLPPFWIFFTKMNLTSIKLVSNEYEICLKVLEMAILHVETQIFKNFWGSMPHTPLESLQLQFSLPPPLPLESPGSTPGHTRNITCPAILQPCHLRKYHYFVTPFFPAGQLSSILV